MMKNILDKFKYFMNGRYITDELNRTLSYIIILFWLLNIFTRNSGLYLLSLMIAIYTIYRALSKDIWSRQKENIRFLELTKNLRDMYKVISLNITSKTHKYYICPNCRQIVKVPKGKGKIEITCPRCRKKFDKKT